MAIGTKSAEVGPNPELVVAGFEQRVDAMFGAESRQPLVRAEIQPPLSPGRGQFVRYYSWSLMAFASRCLYLDEMIDEANSALVENAQHYLDHPKDISDRDSFHWHAETVLRLIEMYGRDGTHRPGRITEPTERRSLEAVWLYVKSCSRLDKADTEQSRTWDVYGSENHHAMDFVIGWHFAKLASEREDYRARRYDDGGSVDDHDRAWNQYIVTYCLERARKGVCVEMMSDHYNWALIKGFYNIYDFGKPQVRHAAGLFLDLFFAYWAQEQIGGVQGGGRSRIYFHEALQSNLEPGIAPIAWLYFGIGQRPPVHGFYVNAALSRYRPPAVVADIALDVIGRGRYEVRQRAQGLGTQGRPTSRVDRQEKPNKLSTDGGGIVRYSYCDPAFILGTPMCQARPFEDWTAISSQNRWQGLIFAGKDDARIVPIVRPETDRVTMNAFWSVQSQGCLITQRLDHHRGGVAMMVWVSRDGLSEPVEESGWTFVESAGAYAAFRAVWGEVIWTDEIYTITKPERRVYKSRPGQSMVLTDERSPVILEVVSKADIESFDAFKAKVIGGEMKVDGGLLRYTSTYGDALTFDTSQQHTPTINGQAIDYAPAKVFDSPFLRAEYNRGVVTISKGAREKVLDFTAFVKH